MDGAWGGSCKVLRSGTRRSVKRRNFHRRAAREGRLVGDNSRNRKGQRFININGRLPLVDEGIDELVREERV